MSIRNEYVGHLAASPSNDVQPGPIDGGRKWTLKV